MGVNVAQDIASGNVIRAGFRDSGVSVNNRMLERHASTNGYYWKSYDFATSIDQQNLFAHPLDFVKNGGEIIFSLPNGLQAYMLTNATGTRLDVGPLNIVQDPKRRRNGFGVENGNSCFGCHVAGMIRHDDQILPFIQGNPASFSNADVSSVSRVYRDEATLNAAFAQDEGRYLTAINATGLGVVQQNPIFYSIQGFEDDLDAKLVAAELGLTLPDFLGRLQHEPQIARQIGFVNASGNIARPTFLALFGTVSSAFGLDGAVQVPATGTPVVASPGQPVASKPSVPSGWTDLTPGGCSATAKDCVYKDNTAGLMVSGEQPNTDWYTAVQNCKNLSYGGFTDGWRLPTMDELVKLQADGIKTLESNNFISRESILAFFFWSSSDSSEPSEARVVTLGGGSKDSTRKDNDLKTVASVCVRGATPETTTTPSPQPGPSTAKVPSGWTDVTPGGCSPSATNCMYKDNTAGLTVTNDQGYSNWNRAVRACQSLSYGGFTSGWRLPRIDELRTLKAHGISTLASPNFITSDSISGHYFWSASSDSGDPGAARIVDLDDGGTDDDTEVKSNSDLTFVCVR